MVKPFARNIFNISVFVMLATFLLTTILAQTNTTHLVNPRETASSIAAQYDISVDELLAANGLSNASQVTVGAILVIPGTDTTDTVNSPEASPTPRGSTAGQAYNDEEQVFEAFPTNIPPTLTPTPLPYDLNEAVTIIEPSQSFTVGVDSVPLRGVVQFDQETMDFWKIELKGNSRATIGSDPMTAVRAGEWVTIDTRVDPIIDGTLGVIPGFPTLSLGNWEVRVVAVSKNGSFAGIDSRRFRVTLDGINPINAAITSPAEGEVIQSVQDVRGTLQSNWAVTSYVIQIIGGNYTNWTPLLSATNDVGNPTVILNDTLTALPSDLTPGRYQLRFIINGPDGNAIQPPIIRSFAYGTDEVSNLPGINIDEPRSMQNGRLSINTATTIIGDINLPDPEGYFKIEIKDANRLAENQKQRFLTWTTIGETQPNSVENGFIGLIPATPGLEPGNYDLRIVVSDRVGNYTAIREFSLNVRQ